MNLHENKNLFRQAVQYTAQQKGIPEIYVEKAVKEISADYFPDENRFLGGTC